MAHTLNQWIGSSVPSIAAAVLTLVWLGIGMATGFPPWWETVLYSAAAMVTLTMVFVIQHVSNRHAEAVMLKLDELVHAVSGARDEVIGAEEAPETERERLLRTAPKPPGT